MKKKLLSVLLSTAMVVSVAGCGAKESETAAPAETKTETAAAKAETQAPAADAPAADAAAEEVHMTFAWWGNQTRNERTQAVVDMYTAANPGVTFDTQPGNWNDYWPKLSTDAAGNSLPDVIAMDYSYLAEYVANGLLYDLSGSVDSGILDVSSIDAGILESGSVDGKLYAVCAGVNAPALLYNKTLLDEAGITVKDCMTMEEFFAVSKEVYEKTGVKTDISYGSCDNFLPYIMRGEGVVNTYNADSLNVTEENLKTFYKIYEDAMAEGFILDASVFAELTLNAVEQSPIVYYSSPETQSWCGFYWSNQVTAMVAAAPEGMEIGITTWPSANPTKSNFLKPSQFLAVSRDAKNPEAAVKFIDFITNSVECNEVLLGEKGIPASSVVADAIAPLLSEQDQMVTKFVNEVASPNSSPISPAVPSGASEVSSHAHENLEKLMYGQMTAEEAAADLFQMGNEIMGRQ